MSEIATPSQLRQSFLRRAYVTVPLIVLLGRPQDGWLAGWSLADATVSHPLDPIAVSEALADLARTRVAVG